MSQTRNTGFLTNVIQVSPSGSITFVSGSTTLLFISSSGAITTTGVISGSTAATASSVANLNQNVQITGSLSTTGTITAQTLNVQTITSSITYSSGSNIFGNSLSNTQTFTGSVLITGSMGINGAPTSGSLHILNQSAYNNGVYVSSTGVNGASITLSSTDTGGLPYTIISTASGNTPGAGTLSIYDGTAYRFTIKSGSVGIGTTNPTSPLTVKAGSRGDTLRLSISGSSSTGDAVGITFGSATYDKAQIIAYNENSGNAAGYLTFWTGGSPATTDMTERMRITSGGNVGIGSTNPTSISTFRTLEIQGSTGAGIRLWNGTNGCNIQHDGTDAYINNFSNGGFYLYTNNTQRLFVTSGGEIQSNNDLKFNSSNTVYNASGIFYIRAASTLNFGAGGTNSLMSLSSSSILSVNGSLQVGQAYNTPNALTIQSDVNWAYGMFSDGSSQYWMQTKFYGDGTDNRGFRVYNVGTSSVVFRVNSVGNYAFAGSNISDRRMKENINYVTSNQLNTILKLKPVTYNQKDTEGNINQNIHTGFIAQDVLEENIPNLVMGNEEGGYGLDYNGVLALAVKAIQELKAENDSLKEILQRNNIV